MYHKPGVLMRMLSWKRTPLYHLGSFGVRLIISPPLPTDIGAAKGPFGPPTSLRMSCTGRIQNALSQSTGGILAARSQYFESRIRSSWEVFAGDIGWCGF